VSLSAKRLGTSLLHTAVFRLKTLDGLMMLRRRPTAGVIYGDDPISSKRLLLAAYEARKWTSFRQ
jgi:hypothetical protein